MPEEIVIYTDGSVYELIEIPGERYLTWSPCGQEEDILSWLEEMRRAGVPVRRSDAV